jgi:hypothetical protein
MAIAMAIAIAISITNTLTHRINKTGRVPCRNSLPTSHPTPFAARKESDPQRPPSRPLITSSLLLPAL